ncbi:MAG: recombinase family protein [Hyphomicrobiaceae bacterium]
MRKDGTGTVAELRSVTHRYGKTLALSDVSVAIASGRMIGLIGPDGVGKSTLQALVAGVRRIQTGTVWTLGGDIAEAPHRRAVCNRIAYMPQGLGRNLYPTLSVYENVDFFGQLFGEARYERRIFAEYVEGRSPFAIVKVLNREGIPAPRSGAWNASTLNGSRQRENGIPSNSLYIGQLTYNRQHFIKDPANGRRQARRNDRSQWMTAEIPELTIIDTQTWEAAQARRRMIGAAPLTQRRGPKRLLLGSPKCEVCGASYIVMTKDHVA